MIGRRVRTRGMGYNPVYGPGGQVIDCDSFWTMITNPGTCFNLFATSPPVKTTVDPATGSPVLTPVGPPAGAPPTGGCPTFQSPKSDGTCGLDWTLIGILGGVVLVVLVVVTRR